MAAIRIYAPDGPTGGEEVALAASPAVLSGRRLAVLDNGKPGADVLMERVASRLAERTGVAYAGTYRKETSGKPCAPDLLEEIAAAADLVVTGTAD